MQGTAKVIELLGQHITSLEQELDQSQTQNRQLQELLSRLQTPAQPTEEWPGQRELRARVAAGNHT